jgi:hypothetical protein
MKCVSIMDKTNGVLAVSLADVLDTLGTDAEGLRWRISGVECLGDGADELHRLSDAQAIVDTSALRALAESVYQIIDGIFAGCIDGDAAPKIVVRAVDSSAYDVEAEDERVLAKVRQRYRNIIDMPD